MENTTTIMDASKHPDEETLIAYIRGDLSPDSLAYVEEHLLRCSTCIEIIAVLNPVFLGNENSQFHKLYTPPRAEDVDSFARYAVRVAQKGNSVNRGGGKQKKLVDVFFVMIRKPLYALPLAAAFLIAASTFFLKRGQEPVQSLAEQLRQELTLYHGDVRLSGGYQSRPVSQLMSAGEPVSPLSRLMATLREEAGKGDFRARHLLAQAYTAEGRFQQADSLYSLLFASTTADAALLTDQGALAFLKGDLTRAKELFTQALALDQTYAEAIFNLARTEEKLGETKTALHLYARYLELDKESDWSQSARNSIRLLQKKR